MSALDAFIIANHNWLVWVIPLVLLGLVHAIIWNRTYKTYVIKGKHRSGRNIIKVVHTVSEDKAVQIFRDFHSLARRYRPEWHERYLLKIYCRVYNIFATIRYAVIAN